MDNLVQRKTRMSMIPLMLLLLFSFPCVHATLELVFIFHECNNVLGNISSDTDSYYNNRNTLLYNMYSDRKIENGFYNSSYGEGSERVYGIGLCRGDVKPDTCRSCLEKSAVLLTIRCGVQKEAIGWYDLCMLRYSNTSIPQQMLTDYKDIVKCTSANATNKLVFDQTVDKLVERLRITAAEGDSSLKFAEGDAPVQSSNQTLYALLQCVPYLSQQNCTSCLETAMSRISPWCRKGKTSNTGGWYLGRSCSLRYETYLFFEPILNHAPAPAPAPAPHLSQLALAPIKGKSNRSRNIIAIVVPVAAGGVVAVVVVLVLLYNYLGAGRPKRNPVQSEGEGDDEGELDNDIKTDELLQFDFATIKSATNDFSDANKLGQGGFGIVYKGTLPDGQQIAIKRLSINSNQGETEFKNEILLTGKLQHRNLVTLLGFCLARRERLLIYEFVPNKSLDYFIFDPTKHVNLNWEGCYKIIEGIARVLLYLHKDSGLQVVHGNLKISNILLDEELNPKISDFGIARLFEINQTEANTNKIVGTL